MVQYMLYCTFQNMEGTIQLISFRFPFCLIFLLHLFYMNGTGGKERRKETMRRKEGTRGEGRKKTKKKNKARRLHKKKGAGRNVIAFIF